MPDWSCVALTAAALIEPVLFCLAGFAVFRHWGRTLAESISSAIISGLMLMSLLQLISVITWFSILFTAMEIMMVALATAVLWVRRDTLVPAAGEVGFFIGRRNRVVAAGFFLCLGYMAFKALFFVPAAHHQAVFHALGDMGANPDFFPANAVILSRHFLRFDTVCGLGLFGFLGYLSLVSSTYALSRRYAWMPISFTVALGVAGMPRFVHHALGPGFEIIPAAVALFAILLTYRLIETPQLSDFLLLACSIVFISSHGAVAFIFSMILAALSLLLLFRRHGLFLFTLVRKKWKTALLSLVPLALFSRVWAWGHASLFDGLEKNGDELMGGIANIIRYLFESVEFSQPVDQFFIIVGGFSPHDVLLKWYYTLLDPLFGIKGAAVPFHVTGKEGEIYSWFGLFGFLLVNAAVLWALVRGPRRLKAVAIALTGYLYLLALIPAWQPENVSYFSFFYACAGFSTAYILPPWHLGLRAKRGIQAIFVILLIYTLSSL